MNDWQDYPVGTKAFAITGGHWYRMLNGWKWNGLDGTGNVFPTPGGDASGEVELPIEVFRLLRNYELRVLKNFINMMPKAYRKRTMNWVIVRDILLTRSSHMGAHSCYKKCDELGIDPDAYTLEEK